MNTINQWLEEKKRKLGNRWTQGETIRYNQALADAQKDLPSLLSTMEAEIRKRIGKIPEAKERIGNIGEKVFWKDDVVDFIHEYFKTQI